MPTIVWSPVQVYGWEPARTFDTLVMGWGKISDLSVCDSQLIAGGFSLTNVSVYVVDLKKVKPFGNPMPSKQIYSRDSPSRYVLFYFETIFLVYVQVF